MRVLLFLSCWFAIVALPTVSHATGPVANKLPSKKSPVLVLPPVDSVSRALQLFRAPAVRPPATKELQRLVLAVKSIEDSGVRMTAKRRLRIATAALRASVATGVDASLLIAIARMESDFRGLKVVDWKCRDRRYSRCRADCGITQHYISGPSAWVIRRCNQLARNYGLSFLKSARELAHHLQYCQKRHKWNKPVRRCVLNRYNSGTYYRTARRCTKRWTYCSRFMCPKRSWVYQVGLVKAEKQHRYSIWVKAIRNCNRVKYRCLSRAAYWKKVMCFRYGAAHGVKSKRNCRRMGKCVRRGCPRRWNLQDIAPVFYLVKPTKLAAR